MHQSQRRDIQAREMAAIGGKLQELMQHFANGEDVHPDAIDPELIPVRGAGLNSELFRLATLLWSVPVSKGYGRRMRYLVRDRSNGKVIGVFGLTDPVFNLRARDRLDRLGRSAATCCISTLHGRIRRWCGSAVFIPPGRKARSVPYGLSRSG